MSGPGGAPRTEPAAPWALAATALSAVFAVVVLLLPARGLTFFWDDWLYFEFLATPRPARWFLQLNEHFMPLFVAAWDAERSLFGPNHTLYLAVNLVVHVANVLVLAKLLGARTGDAASGAIAAALFGVAVCYREVLWWATGLCIELSFLGTLVGFLALERSRQERRYFPVALAATALTPFTWGAGIFAGPALVLEEWFLGERARRAGRCARLGLAWCIPLVCYAIFSRRSTASDLARTPAQLEAALVFVADSIGLGFARQVVLIPAVEPLVGFLIALGYAALVAVAAYALDARGRARLVLAHVHLAFLLGPMGLTRWRQTLGHNMLSVQASHYQYFPALAWATLVALVLAASRRRAPRGALVLALALLGVLGWGHARDTARDARYFSPEARRHDTAWVHDVLVAARDARGPLYDLPVPSSLSIVAIHASDVVAGLTPDVHPTWTTAATAETTAPYSSSTALRESLEPR